MISRKLMISFSLIAMFGLLFGGLQNTQTADAAVDFTMDFKLYLDDGEIVLADQSLTTVDSWLDTASGGAVYGLGPFNTYSTVHFPVETIEFPKLSETDNRGTMQVYTEGFEAHEVGGNLLFLNSTTPIAGVLTEAAADDNDVTITNELSFSDAYAYYKITDPGTADDALEQVAWVHNFGEDLDNDGTPEEAGEMTYIRELNLRDQFWLFTVAGASSFTAAEGGTPAITSGYIVPVASSDAGYFEIELCFATAGGGTYLLSLVWAQGDALKSQYIGTRTGGCMFLFTDFSNGGAAGTAQDHHTFQIDGNDLIATDSEAGSIAGLDYITYRFWSNNTATADTHEFWIYNQAVKTGAPFAITTNNDGDANRDLVVAGDYDDVGGITDYDQNNDEDLLITDLDHAAGSPYTATWTNHFLNHKLIRDGTQLKSCFRQINIESSTNYEMQIRPSWDDDSHSSSYNDAHEGYRYTYKCSFDFLGMDDVVSSTYLPVSASSAWATLTSWKYEWTMDYSVITEDLAAGIANDPSQAVYSFWDHGIDRSDELVTTFSAVADEAVATISPNAVSDSTSGAGYWDMSFSFYVDEPGRVGVPGIPTGDGDGFWGWVLIGVGAVTGLLLAFRKRIGKLF